LQDIKAVILTCLRDSPAQTIQMQLDEMTEQEWGEFLETALKMGLTQIIYSRLRRKGVSFPPGVQQKLLAGVHSNSAFNLGLLNSFHQIADRLNLENIPIILLKGVFLAEMLYGNLGERLITDVDILIHARDMVETVKLIESIGYRTKRPYDPEYEIKICQHLPAYYMTGMPMLEIHLSLLDPMPQFNLDVAGLCQRAVPARVGGKAVYVLNNEDLLLHLCAHAAYNHLYDNALRLLYDIKLLVEKLGESLDWSILARRAQEWGVFKAVYLTLRLTDELIGCELPQKGWNEFSLVDFDERLLEAGFARIFNQNNVVGGLVVLWSQKSRLKRMRDAFRRVFLHPRLLAQKYKLKPGSKRVYLYYPLRLKDLLVKFSGPLTGLVKGDGQKTEAISREGILFDYLGYKQNR
jgi:hypothetical protein